MFNDVTADMPERRTFTEAHGQAILALYRLYEDLPEERVRKIVSRVDAAINAAYEFGRATS